MFSNDESEKSINEPIERKIVIDTNWNDPVDDEKIKAAWLKYAHKIQQKNPRLASILNNHTPTLKSGTILNVKLKNKTQDNELKEQKTNIFLFLKHELKNAALELQTELTVDSQQNSKAFTAAEKAKQMAQKNPALLLLTKKFDLDVQ